MVELYVIDTNVILLAGTNLREVPKDQLATFEKCILFLHKVMEKGASILIDDDCKVINEYRNAYSIDLYPNNASTFLEYVFGHYECVHIEEIADCLYEKYPRDKMLKEFDPPDRKFIAIAYTVDGKAPIVEATDSKWWGIVDNLNKFGIKVFFIDEEYIRNKYIEKIEKTK